ncbi:MAG: tetratricopeptide repeat protein [Leptospiraceae bacterium]|nr:tetratricopeptide repeat protein [Leptospiraceae bacterium]
MKPGTNMRAFVIILGLASLPGFACVSLAANEVRRSYQLEQRGQYKEAYLLMHKLAESNRQHYLAHLRAGWLAYKSGYYKAAVYYYRKAVVLAPTAIEPGLGLMQPLIALARYKEAETVGRAVLAKDAKNYLARSRLAWSLYLSGRYSEAQAYYYYLIVDYPADGEMYIGIGDSLWAQKKYKDACYYYYYADTILPGDPRVLKAQKLCSPDTGS